MEAATAAKVVVTAEAEMLQKRFFFFIALFQTYQGIIAVSLTKLRQIASILLKLSTNFLTVPRE